MAADYLFNFYELLVENIFGSVALAILGVALILVLILLITRTNIQFVVFWLGFYFTAMTVGYFGVAGIILAFIVLASFLAYNIIKMMSGEEG